MKKAGLKVQEDRAATLTLGREVVVFKDDGSRVETKVRLEPWLMGGHSWVVGLEGISGGYSVMRVVPKEAA